MRKFSFAVCASLLLTGCGSLYYPDLYSIPPQAVIPPSQLGAKEDGKACGYAATAMTDSFRAILLQAVKLSCVYESNYRKAGKIEDFSRIPLIAAAGAAGLILIDDGSSAGKDAARVGVGGLVYESTVNAIVPKGISSTYIQGQSALTCVLGNGLVFASSGSNERHKIFEASLNEHNRLTNIMPFVLTIVTTDDPKNPPSDEAKSMLAAARELAGEALTAANTIRSSALTELGAYQGKEGAFHLAISGISSAVASRGRERPSFDFATFQATIAKQVPAEAADALANAAKGAGDFSSLKQAVDHQVNTGAGGLTTEQLTRLTLFVTYQLLQKSTELQGVTPRYSKAIDEVGKCADRITPKP